MRQPSRWREPGAVRRRSSRAGSARSTWWPHSWPPPRASSSTPSWRVTTRSSTSSATPTRRCRSSTKSRRTGAGSTARSCSGSSCSRSSGAWPCTSTVRRHRELIPYVVAVISVVQMFFLFLMVVHNNPFETFLTETPGRRSRAQSAAPELLHGDPPADHVPGVRGADHPVRLRHGGAHLGPSRRCLAARGAALDDVRGSS
jgi:hypothetical protein